MAYGDERRASLAAQVMDTPTAIIPLDELERRLEDAYSESWPEAEEASNALVYHPGTAEITQDLVIPESVVQEYRTAAPEAEPTDLVEATEPEAPAEPRTQPAPVRTSGRHRVPQAPHVLKGRLALLSIAAGATVAGLAVGAPSSKAPAGAPADAPVVQDPSNARAAQLPAPNDMQQFSNVLPEGKARKDASDAAIAATQRPLYVLPAKGTFTSVFGGRWGAMHAGVDIAAPIGTPIVAVEDGTIIDAGPASGFGLWVRLQAADGTITVYGHVNTMTVSKGQKVMAGDEIATVGNRGNSTGPHLHFEVWKDGKTKIDPLPWLAQRGISLGNYAG
ncbi:peptidoglycan DD-metalloendopeptidase family protein [Tsukamurella sp. 8F]|uniref:M23 family metallopeptidase n=1 Tax=unclassified Tsukamurella TaxID=2633480 RepID=UPI0023B8CED3|nr:MULTISPECIES: peptidoglycan DD-metalloendopeptidase family protein [unclassified Tsukamurella]MDF0531931.1 peptidoglycan DD-metalloendopeptidase family protein [Tsukamurella sp. 8J]MDF0586929.1 peptidoglycan DD-metalloendopeptidase family protein [Tsukamurella sp. 8F]